MRMIVLGMHRSGTSLVTNLLGLMGCHVGEPSDLTEANRENPLGFFERRDLRRANDQLLQTAGFDWDMLHGFSANALDPEILARYRDFTRQLIGRLDLHLPWVLKEPRLNLLLPVWRPLLADPIAVLVLRDPLEIARSLEVRNDMSLGTALALWEYYMVHAVNACHGLRTVVVRHHELLTEPENAVLKLHRTLQDFDVQGLLPCRTSELAARIEPDLYRSRLAADEGRDNLTFHQEELARSFDAMPSGVFSDQPRTPSRRALDSLKHHHARRAEENAALKRRLALRNILWELQDLEESNLELEGEIASLRICLDTANSRLEETVQSARGELSSIAVQLDQAGGSWKSLSERLVARLAQSSADSKAGVAPGALEAQLLEDVWQCLSATRDSWRWRLGHQLASILERVLRRGTSELALDRAMRQLESYRRRR